EATSACEKGGWGVAARAPWAGALGGNPPLLFEPAGIVPADGLLAPVVAATEDVVVVHRPILRVRLRASRGRREGGHEDEDQRRRAEGTCHGGVHSRPRCHTAGRHVRGPWKAS